MNKLIELRSEINNYLEKKREEFALTFDESNHVYSMLDINGKLKNDWKSVSRIIKNYYDEFPAEEISLKKANGDILEQERLLKEWADAGSYGTNLGSRTHFLLEKKSLEMFNIKKEVRQPIFECDADQLLTSDKMINAGVSFLNLMEQRNAVLFDTETVLGHPGLMFTGQPDKLWLIENKEKNKIGFLITDYKTNKPKNFETQHYTKPMKAPFQHLPNNAFGHYNLQLPLYGKLLTEMLKGSKYENIGIFGAIIVLLKENETFEEFRIPNQLINQVINLKITI